MTQGTPKTIMEALMQASERIGAAGLDRKLTYAEMLIIENAVMDKLAQTFNVLALECPDNAEKVLELYNALKGKRVCVKSF